MIKCDKSCVNVEGLGETILAEYCVVTHALCDIITEETNADMAKDLMDEAYKMGMTAETRAVKIEKGRTEEPIIAPKTEALLEEILKQIITGGASANETEQEED